MNKDKNFFSKITQPRIENTFLALILLYLFLAFLPLLQGPAPGLDPSWRYGLSRAAGDHLVFGRDIVFTYGKFGYLLVGSATSENYATLLVVRFLIHILLIGAVLLKLIEMSSWWHKLLLVVTVFCGYWSGFLRASDGELFFCVAILMTLNHLVEPKALRWWALPLGVLAGFCLLTKLTLGAYACGALLLFLLGHLYTAIRTRKETEVSLVALSNAILFSVGSCYLFIGQLGSEQLTALGVWISCGLILGTFGLAAEKLNSGKKSQFGVYGFYVGCLVALIISCTSTPLFVEYFVNGLEISSGYSSAMALTGGSTSLVLALFELLAASVFIVVAIRQGRLSVCLASAWMLLLAFKAAFVRADWGHIPIFLTLAPLVFLLLLDQTKEGRWKTGLQAVQGVALAGILFFTLKQEGIGAVTSTLQPSRVYAGILAYVHRDQTVAALLQESNKQLQGERLPAKILKDIGNQRVDVFPWEISVMAINPLNWVPRPILQSYSAYTPALDALDQANYRLQQRDYILYHYDRIDTRHPFFDEPHTFFELLCRYGSAEPEVSFLPLPTLPHAFLLKPRLASACSTSTRLSLASIAWEEVRVLPVQPGKLTRVYLNIEYSLLGKLTKILFRIPAVWINVTYEDGTSEKLHILQETAQDGLLLSHPTQSAEEAFRLFQGKLPKGVRTFSLMTKAPYLFTNKIGLDVEFTPFQVPRNSKAQ
jgi:hypothetical protein